MKQDPVLMFNSDEEQDLMLDESLNLFETSSLIDSGDSAIHLSLDDLANFAQPMVATDGSHNSFDTSIETSSFLSGSDALDIINDASHHPPLGAWRAAAAVAGIRPLAAAGRRASRTMASFLVRSVRNALAIEETCYLICEGIRGISNCSVITAAKVSLPSQN